MSLKFLENSFEGYLVLWEIPGTLFSCFIYFSEQFFNILDSGTAYYKNCWIGPNTFMITKKFIRTLFTDNSHNIRGCRQFNNNNKSNNNNNIDGNTKTGLQNHDPEKRMRPPEVWGHRRSLSVFVYFVSDLTFE